MNGNYEPKFGGYPFAFSIVMAAYNVDTYLCEAIDSIIQQTFGWKYTQIILVDDGSTDDTSIICDSYKQKYPDNIVVIHKENGGVSSARNEGLKHVRGQYVNFMDSDDKLSINTLTDVYAFFELFGNQTDVVCIPMQCFEKSSNEHIQNYKYNNGRRVVNLLEEWNVPCTFVNSTFFSAEAIESVYFDSQIKYGEDLLFVNKILLDKCTVGLQHTCRYYYRMRNSGSSAMQNATNRKEYYLNCVHSVAEDLFSYAQKKRGNLPLFIQYNIMYDLQWRLKINSIPLGVLTSEEEEAYKYTIHSVLSYIDDSVIDAQRFFPDPYKYFTISQRHNAVPVKSIINGEPIYSYLNAGAILLKHIKFQLSHIDIHNNTCSLCGFLSIPIKTFHLIDFVLYRNGTVFHCTIDPIPSFTNCIGDPIYDCFKIWCEFDLRNDINNRISFYALLEEKNKHLLNVEYNNTTFPITKEIANDYTVIGEYMLSHSGNYLNINKWNLIAEHKKKNQLNKEILNNSKLGGKTAVIKRKQIQAYLHHQPADCWLICSKTNPADPLLLEFINNLHQENARIQLYIVFTDNYYENRSLGQAKVIFRNDSEYINILSSCSRIYCSHHDWGKISPSNNGSIYRSLLRHPELRIIDDMFHVIDVYTVSPPIRAKKAALRSILLAFLNQPTILRIRTQINKFIHKLPQKYIVLESMPAYSDNTYAVYQYMCTHKLLENYRFYWVLQKSSDKRTGFPSITPDGGIINKIHYKLIMSRAAAIICSNKIYPKVREDQLLINLGHGSCLKSVFGYYSMPGYMDYILIQAPAFETATRYEHRVNINTVITALGYPRNDDLYGAPAADPHSLFPQDFRRLIVWYPTYRQHKNGYNIMGNITLPLLHDEKAAHAINNCARENRVLLVLKPHFAQDTSYIRDLKLSNILFIDDTFFAQHHIRPYQFLHLSDAMLTDYSSVYYDYLLQDRPIGMIWEDIAEYNHGKSFAVDTDVFCAGAEKLYTVEDLCGFIARVGQDIDLLKEQRAQTRDLTNYATDGKNAERTALWLQEIIRAYPEKLQLGKTQY